MSKRYRVEVLSKGPTFAIPPKRTIPELLGLVRRVAFSAPGPERDS